jgi:hypothetical protein
MFLRRRKGQVNASGRVVDRCAYCLAALVLCVYPTAFAEDIPEGYGISRYARLWEHNPFATAAPKTSQILPSRFEKLSLEGWSKNGSQEMIFVRNSETNEVECLTVEPNKQNLRLLTIHVDQDPQLVEAVISDGRAQGPVKFRTGQNTPPVAQAATTEQGQRATPTNAASFGESNKQGVVAAKPIIQQARHRFYPGIPRVHLEGGLPPASIPK